VRECCAPGRPLELGGEIVSLFARVLITGGQRGREVVGLSRIVVYFGNLQCNSVPASMRLRRRATDRK
jgi:hypothetical protein